ncbi:hypothetical protein B0H17DRAFT_1251775 [Mycena rosella]|uniref:Uncharacterized protein n=1 Tax=Mycena rosella TaxID=1033263 RepID=A0AAD7G8J2_MYCRO|nr:hypothetical protein B0H17DRAFT_1251775 [Mycena rosella]
MTVSIQVNASTAECPDLTPQLVSHFFQYEKFLISLAVIDHGAQASINSLKSEIRLPEPLLSARRFNCIFFLRNLGFLPYVSSHSPLVSFHEVMLSDGPRPDSFYDQAFFTSKSNVHGCGARRSAVHRALHMTALKAAWDCGIMLKVSNENAASCFLLDLIAQASHAHGPALACGGHPMPT